MRKERKKWPCLRCGIDVSEYRGVCLDCQSFVRETGEKHLWFEPKEERRERMRFLNQIGLVPNMDRKASRERSRRGASRVHGQVREV
jgi:predicted ATP-dependent serine protease